MQRLTVIFETADGRRCISLPVGTFEVDCAGMVVTDRYGTVAGLVMNGNQVGHWQVRSDVFGGGEYARMRVERSLGHLIVSEGRPDYPRCSTCAPHELHPNVQCNEPHCACPLERVR